MDLDILKVLNEIKDIDKHKQKTIIVDISYIKARVSNYQVHQFEMFKRISLLHYFDV